MVIKWSELKTLVDSALKEKGLEDIEINYIDFSDTTIYPLPNVYITKDGLTVW